MLIGGLQDDRLSTTGDVEIGDLEGQGFGVEVGAVTENDDGEAVGGEAQDVGVEADGVAVVPHAVVIAVGVEEPAEAVGDRRAFGTVGVGGPFGLGAADELRGSPRGQHFFFAKKRVLSKCIIPLCKIG